MTVASDLATTVTAVGSHDGKLSALIDGVNAAIQTIITTPGADAAAAAAKLTTLKADIVANKSALVGAVSVGSAIQPQAGVRPLIF